jgi:hypothetical protein
MEVTGLEPAAAGRPDSAACPVQPLQEEQQAGRYGTAAGQYASPAGQYNNSPELICHQQLETETAAALPSPQELVGSMSASSNCCNSSPGAGGAEGADPILEAIRGEGEER